MEQEEIHSFIKNHLHLPIAEVALLLSKKPQLPKELILNQINGWQKSRHKLPEWHKVEGILFPDKLALEQASSEITAKYKASLVKGKCMADLTGGLGIDSYYFSKNFQQLHYVETDLLRYEKAMHNFSALGATNIELHQNTAEDFLQIVPKLDFVFLDPDRRSKNKKLVQIEDCSPNFLQLKEEIFSKTEKVMLKYSPMLDISLALTKISDVEQVHVVSVDNECKEILLLLKKNFALEPQIIAIDLKDEQEFKLQFYLSEEASAIAKMGVPEKYIYEPNAAIRKAGAFKLTAQKYGLKKLHPSTHLYTSDGLINSFPGRIFSVQKEANPKQLKGQKLNIISRNFPLKPAEIKKKYKLQDGGNQFLIATTLKDKRKVFLLCEKTL